MKLNDAGTADVAEPLALLRVSHPWADPETVACAANCRVPPPAFDTVTWPLPGALPCASEKLSVAGETERTAGLEMALTTVKVTGTKTLVAPDEIVTLPVNVPGDKFVPLTETATDPGVLPVVLEEVPAESQFPLLDADTVKLVPVVRLEAEMLWAAG